MMSSISFLGGARCSVGRTGRSPIHPFLGQSSCTLLVDRVDERACFTQFGAVQSSEAASCSFPGYCSVSKVTRFAPPYDAAGLTSSGFLSAPITSRKSYGSSAGEHCSATSRPSPAIVYAAPTLCRHRDATPARVLGLPSLAGFAPSLRVHRSIGSGPWKGSRDGGRSTPSGRRRFARSMAVNPNDGEKDLSEPDIRERGEMQITENWDSNLYTRNSAIGSDAKWDQLNMIIRVVHSSAMYGGLVLAGSALCTFTGVDCWGGFEPSIETFVKALGWAIPPMMALLLILEDEVVKICPPARAIRDVEDEELMDFFVGMNPWQFIFVVAAGSLSEELFFRVAIQGGLAHALQYSTNGADQSAIGVSALTTIIPSFAPFAQALAAVLTASLTGSMYYLISFPKDPAYVIAPVSGSNYAQKNRRDVKKRIKAWSERRDLKQIYSPLMEALLALYLGFEWVQTGNIFGPIITHTLYSLVVGGNGLRRIHDNRFKLRQRVSHVIEQKVNSDVIYLDKLN